MKTVTKLIGGLSFAAVLAFAGVASASEAPAVLAIAAEPAQADEPEVMSLDDLGSLSGGTGVDVNVVTEQTLNAVNTGNTVSGNTVTSGTMNIGSNAFSGFSGIGNFVMNTGHNNNLQASMSVNVVLAPPGTP
jgi:hypothetical protein